MYDLLEFKSPFFHLSPTKSRRLDFSRCTELLKVKFFVGRTLQCVQTLRATANQKRCATPLSGALFAQNVLNCSCRSCPFVENENVIMDVKRSKTMVPLRTRLVLSIQNANRLGASETLQFRSNVLLL